MTKWFFHSRDPNTHRVAFDKSFIRRKKSYLFPLTRPTLVFHADPKVFFQLNLKTNPS